MNRMAYFPGKQAWLCVIYIMSQEVSGEQEEWVDYIYMTVCT